MARRITPREKAVYEAAEWRKALADGRVVRYNGMMTLTSHLTQAGAAAFLAQLQCAGDMTAEIVRVVYR